jgi:3-phosphoshikimate 1-carboxyvinyltransferase
MGANVRRVERLAPGFDARIELPGSKSITNRALLCAALADGTSVLRGALLADDSLAMIEGLRALGVGIDIGPTGPDGNATLAVRGVQGRFTVAGAFVHANLSGTTSRFLLAAASLGSGTTTIDGGAPLRRRPMSDGIAALRAAGLEVSDVDATLPVAVSGTVRGRPIVPVSASASSQFLSGLLMSAPCWPHGAQIRVEGVVRSERYIDMTLDQMSRFGVDVAVTTGNGFRLYDIPSASYRSTEMVIEPDASAASYFFAAAAVCGGRVRVNGLAPDSVQGDASFVDVVEVMGATVERGSDFLAVTGPESLALRGGHFNMAEISDTAQTLAAIAPFALQPVEITGIGFIRGKETDRIASVVTELQRCGVDATEHADGMVIEPGPVTAATVHTYEDHRMAMSFAVLGLRTGTISIADPEVVNKTFPRFWDTLDSLRRPS